MRPALPFLFLLLATACSHVPAVALPPGPQHFEEPAYTADVRARIVRHNGDVYACYQEAAAEHPLQGHDISSTFRYDRERHRFLFVGPPEIPDAKRRPLTAFALAFERCLGPRASGWIPLRPPDGTNVNARFHFLPPGVPVGPLPAPSGTAPTVPDDTAMDPAWISPLFDEQGTRAFVDVAELTVPKLISGERIHYTQEALARRIEGVMRIRCRITTEGILRDCNVLQTVPYMEEPVLAALATNRYEPVLYRGMPTEVDYSFTIQLKIRQR